MVEGKYFYFGKLCTVAHFSDSSHAGRHQIVLVDDVSLQLLRPFPWLSGGWRPSGPPSSESEEFSSSGNHWVIWGHENQHNLPLTAARDDYDQDHIVLLSFTCSSPYSVLNKGKGVSLGTAASCKRYFRKCHHYFYTVLYLTSFSVCATRAFKPS